MVVSIRSTLRRYLPRRRRRVWRHVSRPRRSIGLAVFALLVGLLYGYWWLSSGDHVRDLAVRYLSQLTGGKVQLAKARFSLTEGIRLEDLRLYLGEQLETPFLEGPLVMMKYSRASLLKGRLEITEIFCLRPRVTIVEDVRTQQSNVGRLFPVRYDSQAATRRLPRLPAIRLREGELEYVDLDQGKLLPVGRSRLPLLVTLLPSLQRGVYELTVEGENNAISGHGDINLRTGQANLSGLLGLEGLDRALPRKYRTWRQRYKLAGQVTLAGSARLGGANNSLERLSLRLAGVSMQLPAEEGGWKLANVAGNMVFTPDGVQIEHLAGQVEQAGNAAFELTGRFEGYDSASPCQAKITLHKLPLPLELPEGAPWTKTFDDVCRRLQPRGQAELTSQVRRDEKGQWHAELEADLAGLSICPEAMPLRIEGMQGKLRLSGKRLELTGVSGRYGGGKLSLDGWLEDYADKASICGHLHLAGQALPLEDALRDALPVRVRQEWQNYSPKGQAGVDLDLSWPEKGAEPKLAGKFIMDGGVSMAYWRFPYRIEQLRGTVEFDNQGNVRIVDLTGRNGAAAAAIGGTISPGNHEITVNLTNVGLDEQVVAALPEQARQSYLDCGLTGRCDVTNATIRRKDNGPVEFVVPAALREVRICHRWMPYALDEAVGTVTIRDNGLSIEHLTGRHGKGRITVGGRVAWGKRPGLHLDIAATDLEFSPELRSVLPEPAWAAWDTVNPSGEADAKIAIDTFAGGKPYRIELNPRDMAVCYRYFPYPIRHIAGQAVLEEGNVELTKLSGKAGAAVVEVGGHIRSVGDRQRAVLAVHTAPVAVDGPLLAALPAGLVRTLGLKSGGAVRVDLDELVLASPGLAAATRPTADTATAPSGAPTSAPLAASGPAPGPDWSWQGTIGFSQAVMELGVGGHSFTGKITGSMGSDGGPERLATRSQVVMESFTAAGRELKNFSAELSKSADDPLLRLQNLYGQCYGGSVSGFAQVHLGGPMKYGLNLAVENIDLERFLTPTRPGAASAPAAGGVLGGTMQISGIANDPDSRRSAGRLVVERARLRKVPVMLDLLAVVTLALPGDQTFETATIEYTLRGQQLTFEEIFLQAAGGAMLGKGTLDTAADRLDLVFLTGAGRKLPRLDALAEMAESISGELMSIHVTGPLAAPRMQTVPFRSLDNSLREMLAPPKRRK